MEEKKRINVYLDKKLMDLVHMEVDNVSELFNNFLTEYLSATSIENIDRKISEHHDKIKALEIKRTDLTNNGVAEEKKDDIVRNILMQMRSTYVKRRDQSGDNLNSDELWISSPRNIQKCKMMGKQPLEFLYEIREWYENEY